MYLSRALAALGHAQLVAGDAPGAVQSLRRVRELEHGLGVDDPARGRWHGDLAEALVRVGRAGEAQDVIDVTRRARAAARARERARRARPGRGAGAGGARRTGGRRRPVDVGAGPAGRSWATAWRRRGPLSPWPGCAPSRGSRSRPSGPTPASGRARTTRRRGCSAAAVRCPGCVRWRRPRSPRRPRSRPRSLRRRWTPSPGSPRPNARSRRSSWRVRPTARSPDACSSASRRSRRHSPGSTGSWGSGRVWTSSGWRRDAVPN